MVAGCPAYPHSPGTPHMLFCRIVQQCLEGSLCVGSGDDGLLLRMPAHANIPTSPRLLHGGGQNTLWGREAMYLHFTSISISIMEAEEKQISVSVIL